MDVQHPNKLIGPFSVDTLFDEPQSQQSIKNTFHLTQLCFQRDGELLGLDDLVVGKNAGIMWRGIITITAMNSKKLKESGVRLLQENARKLNLSYLGLRDDQYGLKVVIQAKYNKYRFGPPGDWTKAKASKLFEITLFHSMSKTLHSETEIVTAAPPKERKFIVDSLHPRSMLRSMMTMDKNALYYTLRFCQNSLPKAGPVDSDGSNGSKGSKGVLEDYAEVYTSVVPRLPAEFTDYGIELESRSRGFQGTLTSKADFYMHLARHINNPSFVESCLSTRPPLLSRADVEAFQTKVHKLNITGGSFAQQEDISRVPSNVGSLPILDIKLQDSTPLDGARYRDTTPLMASLQEMNLKSEVYESRVVSAATRCITPRRLVRRVLKSLSHAPNNHLNL